LSIPKSMSLPEGFSEIDNIELKKLRSHKVPIIDIRTPQEWQQGGIINEAHQMMFFDAFGQDHAKEWIDELEKTVKDKTSPFVIYCAHANRTKAIGEWLTKQMGYNHVYELAGGIEHGWRNLGEETVPAK